MAKLFIYIITAFYISASTSTLPQQCPEYSLGDCTAPLPPQCSEFMILDEADRSTTNDNINCDGDSGEDGGFCYSDNLDCDSVGMVIIYTIHFIKKLLNP